MKTMIFFDNERTLSRRKLNTLETTKPPNFCESFVLYGAAPGVESSCNYLILNKLHLQKDYYL
jgi:hypothetical protein